MKQIENIIWQAKLVKKSNWLESKKILSAGIEEFPADKRLYLELADLYFSKRIYKKAIETYQKYLAFEPLDDGVLFRIGNCFLSLNEFHLALTYFHKVNDTFQELLYNKAYAYSKTGKHALGIEVLKELINFKVTSEVPFIFMAELYFAERKYDEAVKYLDMAENKFGKSTNIFYLRGLAYSHKKQWLKAYVEFDYARKLKKRSSHFFRAFGIACEKVGKTDLAISYLLKSIKAAPRETTNYIELIHVYLSHNKLLEAKAIMNQAQSILPFSLTLSLLRDRIQRKIRLLETERDHTV
jgi:tetratricopeptide (TPR) repeat protein